MKKSELEKYIKDNGLVLGTNHLPFCENEAEIIQTIFSGTSPWKFPTLEMVKCWEENFKELYLDKYNIPEKIKNIFFRKEYNAYRPEEIYHMLEEIILYCIVNNIFDTIPEKYDSIIIKTVDKLPEVFRRVSSVYSNIKVDTFILGLQIKHVNYCDKFIDGFMDHFKMYLIHPKTKTIFRCPPDVNIVEWKAGELYFVPKYENSNFGNDFSNENTKIPQTYKFLNTLRRW